jgi:hypothetical protein
LDFAHQRSLLEVDDARCQVIHTVSIDRRIWDR